MGANVTRIEFTDRVSGLAQQAVLAETYRAGNKDVRVEATGAWKDIVSGADGGKRRVGSATITLLKTDKGLCDFGKVMVAVPNFLNSLGSYLQVGVSSQLHTWAKWFDGWWKGLLTIPRTITMLPDAAKDVKEGFLALRYRVGSLKDRCVKVLTGVREGSDLTTMYALSVAMVAKLFKETKGCISGCFGLATVASTVHDVTSLTLNAGKYRRLNAVDVTNAPQVLKDAVKGTKTNTLLATAKDVSGIAAGIFAVITLVSGLALLPALAAATLALLSAGLGTAQHIHEETLAHKIDVFKGITAV